MLAAQRLARGEAASDVGNKYYESELQYLREMGREFAQVHPATAGLLAERGNDPDVERLLEGFAFLTSRIRERIDDAVPEVVHGLTQLLLPHYLRPVPAASIIQYQPNLRAMRAVQRVPRDTVVRSNPIHGTSCQFKTTQSVDLLPLELTSVRLDETASNRPIIRIALETTEAGTAVLARKDGVRFLLFGELSLTATVYLWLMRHFTGATIRFEDGSTVDLGRDVIKPSGFGRDQALIPWPTLAHEGYRYLQEYFCLPGKFLFFDVTRFDKIAAFRSTRFELLLAFDRPPGLNQRITTETFRLFCTPVINLFETTADPIKVDPKVHEHLLRASSMEYRHAEIFEVTSVIGIRQGRVDRREYKPFVGYHHATDSRESSYYTLRPTPALVDDGVDTYLSVVTPLGQVPSRDEEVLSIDLQCSNRSLPAELKLGEICDSPRGESSSSSAAPFKNISAVTNPIRPKLGSELLWRMLSHLAVGRTSLGDPEVLKALLDLYNFQRDTSPSVGRANELKVESIRSVQSDPSTRLMGGAPVRGVQTRIEVEESKLGSAGEAFLFGAVLDEVFATHVPINSFNELHLHLHPSKLGLRWVARSGQRRIL